MTNSVGRENNFDGLRLILALVVVLGHQDNRLSWASDAAVMGFFVISGCLVSQSWFSDPHPWRFAVRRFLSIPGP